MPPHNGHLLMCRAARALVDELTILVCWLPDDPVPGELRLRWMRALLPDCRVVGHGETVPQAPEEAADFWQIWRGIARAAHPEPIDRVFASEHYGARLAAELGAAFWPIDPSRETLQISATAIRTDAWANWEYLPGPVRAYYARTICLHGPESTGKSTLARQLAQHFGTISVAEYGRTWWNAHGPELGEEDLRSIAQGQGAMIEAARALCNRRVILDSDPLLTAVWAEMLLGRRIAELDEWLPVADLYLLLDIDMPWADDGTRYFGDAEMRRKFFDLSKAELERRGVPWVLIGGAGEARFENAVAAIEAAALIPK